jgi:hypothetical protein
MAIWLGKLLGGLVGAVVDWLGENIGRTNDEDGKMTKIYPTKAYANAPMKTAAAASAATAPV